MESDQLLHRRSGAERTPRVRSADAVVLVYLLGEVVQPFQSLEVKRRSLLDGLCDWLGGDFWFRKCQSPRQPPELMSNAEEPSARLPDPEDQPWLARTWCSADGSEVVIAILRKPGDSLFTPDEARLAALVFDEVSWLFENPGENSPSPRPLTPRQEEIAGLLRDGWERKRIASHLKLSEHTVSWHIQKLYRRLGVRRRTDLR